MNLLLWSVAAHAGPVVTMSRARLVQLVTPAETQVEPPPEPLAARRDVTLSAGDADELEIIARWTVDVQAPTAVRWLLAGPEIVPREVRLDGAPVMVERDGEGTTLAVNLARDAVIEFRGVARRDATLTLRPAAAGTITHPADVAVSAGVPLDRRHAAGAPAAFAVVPPRATAPDRDLVVGESALGVTVGDADTQVRGVVRFVVSGRPIGAVAFSVPGAAADLELRGPQIASFTREGDRIEVTLREPERSLVAIELSWSSPTPRGEVSELPVPRVVPEGVFKASAALQLARETELDLIPELAGWTATASAELPAWGRGLVAGTPVGAFTGRGDPGRMSVLRFSPASGPPTIIDVASFSGLVSPEGRVLLRATYAVRNDRGAVLRVVPPAGLTPIGARVSGKMATVGRDGDTWLVPLEKSVETVQGLLAFPVEVLFVGERPGWDLRRGAPFALPTVDAEVAVARLTLSLPRDWAPKVVVGEGDAVEAFTAGEGVTYGYAIGDARAAQAEVLFQEAVDAWKDNDFRATEQRLDDLEQMGAQSEVIGQLRSNLAVVEGEASGLVERRVLEQARARSLDDELQQQDELKKAEEAYSAGEYDEAEEAYSKALELGDELAKLRNEEDLEQVQVNRDAVSKLEATRSMRAQKSAQSTSNALPPPAPAAAPVVEPAPEPEAVTILEPLGYLAGGVAGGSVGGEMIVEEPVTREYLQRIPSGRTYQSAVQTVSGGDRGAPKPAVTASGLGVVLPSAGAAVHYQSLLLPPGTSWEVTVRAVPRRTP